MVDKLNISGFDLKDQVLKPFQKTSVRRISAAVIIVSALLTPSTVHAAGYYEELAPGECTQVGSRKVAQLVRICNRSTSSRPDFETAILIDSDWKAVKRVIPEDYGINTKFIFSLRTLDVPFVDSDFPVAVYPERVLAVEVS